MAKEDITLLIDLADAEEKDEFSESFGLSAEMQEVLKQELEAERKEKMAKAVKKIVQLMKDTQAVKESHITAIRTARRVEKEAKQKLQAIERAQVYAQETGNYLPLVKLTRTISISEFRGMDIDESKWTVPEDFKPRVEKDSVKRVTKQQ